MTIFAFVESIKEWREQKWDDARIFAGLFLVFALLAFPIIAHAASMLGRYGFDVMQFKAEIQSYVDSETQIKGFGHAAFMVGFFVYGMTACFALAFGVVVSAVFVIMYVWSKLVERICYSEC